MLKFNCTVSRDFRTLGFMHYFSSNSAPCQLLCVRYYCPVNLHQLQEIPRRSDSCRLFQQYTVQQINAVRFTHPLLIIYNAIKYLFAQLKYHKECVVFTVHTAVAGVSADFASSSVYRSLVCTTTVMTSQSVSCRFADCKSTCPSHLRVASLSIIYRTSLYQRQVKVHTAVLTLQFLLQAFFMCLS